MKTLRFLLVTTFMLTLMVGSAGAQAGGTETGYVALPIQFDPAMPLRIQARDAYERMLPAFLAAQKSGSILEFQPQFAAGVVKITFAAGARPVMLAGLAVIVMKLVAGVDMTGNPLLLLAVFSMMVCVQFLSLGLLGEVSARIYFGRQGRQHFTVRERMNFESSDEPVRRRARAA